MKSHDLNNSGDSSNSGPVEKPLRLETLVELEKTMDREYNPRPRISFFRWIRTKGAEIFGND